MNDTILSARQKTILNLINQANGLSSKEIELKLKVIYGASRLTVIRDLNALLKKELVLVQGKARAVRYYPLIKNPLLRTFDMERYFQDEPDSRVGVKTSFDFEIFPKLKDLFLKQELEHLTQVSQNFANVLQNLNKDILKRELERFIIELSWKSSKIEGNTYSLLQTETLIKEKIEATGKKREEAIMILNHKSAFEVILNNRQEFKSLTLAKVTQLHNTLVKDLNIGTGTRKQAVGITGTRYKPLDNEFKIKEVLEKMLFVINGLSNPYEKALVSLFMISYIQPFSDGNKRTGRMLANAILLAHDLYPISYRSVNEEDYKKALILFYEQGSIVPLKNIFIEQFVFANKTYLQIK